MQHNTWYTVNGSYKAGRVWFGDERSQGAVFIIDNQLQRLMRVTAYALYATGK